MLSKAYLNFIVDLLGFAAFVCMTATGFVLRFVLPPGSGRISGEGIGTPSGRHPVSLLWGMTRHEWGDVHFWTSIALFAFLSLHLFLHWRWIVCVVQGKDREGASVKFMLGAFALAALIALALAPFFSPVDRMRR